MKQRLLPIMMAAVAMLALGISACSSDSDEESKDPRLRILGKWKINYDSGRNTSSEDMYYIFTSDGKILFPLDITNQTVIEGTYQFVDGWTYNEEKDEVTAVIINDYHYNDRDLGFSYRCYISKNNMTWVGSQGVADTRKIFERK